MREVLEHYRPRIEASDILDRLGLRPRGYFIVSLHREENVDSSPRLAALMETLNALAARYDMPVVVSTHPRTRKRLVIVCNRSSSAEMPSPAIAARISRAFFIALITGRWTTIHRRG